MDTDDSPASAAKGATPISDILANRGGDADMAGEMTGDGAATQGDGPDADAGAAEAAPPGGAAAAPSAQPAPTAARPPQARTTPPPAGQAGDVDPADDPRSPRWFREHMKKTNAELAALRAERERGWQPPPQQHQQPQRQPPPLVRLPNPAEDPEGYHRAITGQFNRQMEDYALRQTMSLSERFARSQHGAENFEQVKAWLGTQSEELEDFFTHQPDPWASAFAHYQREMLAEEIGDDPAAWREKERQRMREELLEELQAEGGGEPAPQTPAARPQMRPQPPAPASTARSAQQSRDGSGRFTGPAPISGVLRHKF